jgi:hypothetical protein
VKVCADEDVKALKLVTKKICWDVQAAGVDPSAVTTTSVQEVKTPSPSSAGGKRRLQQDSSTSVINPLVAVPRLKVCSPLLESQHWGTFKCHIACPAFSASVKPNPARDRLWIHAEGI